MICFVEYLMESTDVDKYNTTAFKKSLSSKAKLAILCPRPKGLLFFLQWSIARGFEQEHKSHTLTVQLYCSVKVIIIEEK